MIINVIDSCEQVALRLDSAPAERFSMLTFGVTKSSQWASATAKKCVGGWVCFHFWDEFVLTPYSPSEYAARKLQVDREAFFPPSRVIKGEYDSVTAADGAAYLRAIITSNGVWQEAWDTVVEAINNRMATGVEPATTL